MFMFYIHTLLFFVIYYWNLLIKLKYTSTHLDLTGQSRFWFNSEDKISILEYLIQEHVEDLGINGKIILEWILGKKNGCCGVDASGLG